MKWGSKEFKALQQEWYQRLAEAGFIDHEHLVGGDMRLIQSASNVYRQADDIQRDSKCAYFSLIARYAADEAWSDEADELIMTRRGEGIAIKLICAELKALGLKCHRMTVRRVIHRFEARWGIRERKRYGRAG